MIPGAYEMSTTTALRCSHKHTTIILAKFIWGVPTKNSPRDMNNFDVHPGKIDILIRLKIIGGGNKIMYE